jgi:hypothetical protein
MKKFLATVGMVGLLSLSGGPMVVFAQAPPEATSVTPSSGPIPGGTAITIDGMHLDGVTVTIGGNPATNVIIAGNNQSLTATTPAGTAGAKDVVVVNAEGTSTLAGGFTYTAATTTYTLNYAAGANGSLTGSLTQVIDAGTNGTAVVATADSGYHFVNWSDSSTSNPRTDTNVSGNISVTANFAADTVIEACNGSTFDTFATGTVNGQFGWHVSGDFDQEVVSNSFGYPSFGCQSLRISDATTSVFMYNQTFSHEIMTEAGETEALDRDGATGTPRFDRFEAQFDLASVMQAEQAGMHLSVSPDRGDGTRMSSIGFEDTAGGINVFFDDVTGTSTPVTFNNTQIATGLSRSAPHTFKFLMDFIDGASNDIVKIFIDNTLVHTGTSWENFYRYDADAFPAPDPNTSRTVNSLVFYERGTATPANHLNGYLIDNLSISATSTATSTPVSTSTPPVITLNGSSTMNVTVNTIFTDPGATATDDIDGTVPVVATGTVDTAVIGNYSILYSATDSHSNVATTSRTVNVVATSTSTTTPPVITLNGSSTLNILLNSIFTDPGATATDAEDGTVAVVATGTVNTAATGTYSILYTATDSDTNVATTSRTWNVVATSSVPVVTLNGSSTIEVMLNTEFVDPGATATDNEDGTLPVVVTGTVDTNALGTYTRTYTATDSDSNVGTATRTVRVVAGSPSGGGGGGGGGGGYFIFSPLPGFSSVTSTNPSTGGSPISVSLVSTPTGQVLGVAVYNFKRNMKIGATGDDVQELQKYLISQGYLVLKNPTKYFGPMTWNALKKWQKAKGLPNTGYFGPMSRAAILQ